MADDAPDDLPQPVWFSARLPADERFAEMAGQLAVRVAQSSGFEVEAAQEIGRAVGDAVQGLIRDSGNGAGALEITFEAGEQTFDVRVQAGQQAVLSVTRPRPQPR